jgi:aspartyl protease family protein
MKEQGRAMIAAALLALAGAAHAVDIDVVGLFPGKAVVVIDGRGPRTLTVGQATAEGVRLIRSDSNEAEFEIAGKRQVMGMGRGRFGGSLSTDNPTATLYADGSGHFVSEGTINGVAVRFLVDTGATTVSLNSRDAGRIGLDYKSGMRLRVSTANGIVNARGVKLDTVRIGEITLHNVEAVVHDGDSPPIVLIGMSVLNRLEMKREGAMLTLTKRY